MWNNLIPNGFVGDITDASTELVKFTDEYQILQTSIKSATFYALAKGIVSAKNSFSGMINDIKNVSYAMNLASSSSAMTKEQFASFSVILSGLSDKQLKLVLSNSNLTESEMIKALTIDGTTEAEARQKLVTLGITQANQQAAVSTFSLNGSMKALFATISANPIMVLTMAFTALVSIYQKVQREQEEARKQAVEMADKYDEQAKSLADLKQEYINIVDSESDVTKKTEELNKWKETLIETYGLEKEALENVNLEREKGLGLIDDEITKNRINSAETWLTDHKDAYEDAKKKLTSRNNSSENSVIAQANVVEQVTKDTLNEFSDNFNDILKQLSISNPTKDNPLVQIKVKGSNTLEQSENLNEILNEITSIKVTKGLNDAEEKLYNSLMAKQKAYKKVVTDDILEIYETGNKYTNSIKLFNFETDNGINFENVTQDTYKEFRDKLLESLGFSDRKDSTAFSLDIEQVLIDMIPDLEKAYRGIEDSVSEEMQNVTDTAVESIETASKTLEDLQKAYDDLSKSASNFTKVQKTFTSVLDEQKKHGQLSASTIQELTDAGYAQALVVDSETGAVTLNEQAYEQLNKQKRKTIELDLEAEKSALVTQLNDEKTAIADLTREYAALNQAPNKTQDITDRISEISLELIKRGENITAISELIDKINGNISSLDAPEFGSDKKEKPQSVLDFESEYAHRQHEIDMGRMQEDEAYYDWLLSAAHTAYDGLEDYQEDLWKYEEEVYKWRTEQEQKLFDKKIDNYEKLADKALETNETYKKLSKENQELADFNKKMQSEYGLGNVDLTKRPKVSADAMRKAGYDAEDGETATVYTSSTFMWQGDDKNGKNVVVHYTPILPDGTVLDEKSLSEYLDSINESEDLLKADTKGIILKVDTDFDISDEDLKSLETDKPTENIQNITKACDDWDIALHEVQAEWLDLSDAAEKSSDTIISSYDYAREQLTNAITELQQRINDIRSGVVSGTEDDIEQLEEDIDSLNDKLKDIDDKEVTAERDFLKDKKDEYSDFYDEQIDKLKEQQDEIEKLADQEKEAIQAKIDLLEEANSKKSEEIDLEKKRQELEKAKSQHTIARLNTDGTTSYVVDAEKINDAQEEYDNAKYEYQKSLLEAQIKTIEKATKEQSEKYDDQIKLIEEQKKMIEEKFDALIKPLDDFLDGDKQTASNANVWDMISKISGSTYENGVWSDKNGNAIDINNLVAGIDDLTEQEKENSKKSDVPQKKSDSTENSKTGDDKSLKAHYELLAKYFQNKGMKNVTADSLEKYSMNLINNGLAFKNPVPNISENVATKTVAYNNSRHTENITNNIGDIIINNPVGSAEDLGKEILKNGATIFSQQTHTNRK